MRERKMTLLLAKIQTIVNTIGKKVEKIKMLLLIKGTIFESCWTLPLHLYEITTKPQAYNQQKMVSREQKRNDAFYVHFGKIIFHLSRYITSNSIIELTKISKYTSNIPLLIQLSENILMKLNASTLIHSIRRVWIFFFLTTCELCYYSIRYLAVVLLKFKTFTERVSGVNHLTEKT